MQLAPSINRVSKLFYRKVQFVTQLNISPTAGTTIGDSHSKHRFIIILIYPVPRQLPILRIDFLADEKNKFGELSILPHFFNKSAIHTPRKCINIPKKRIQKKNYWVHKRITCSRPFFLMLV